MLNHGLPNQRVCFRKRSWGFSVPFWTTYIHCKAGWGRRTSIVLCLHHIGRPWSITTCRRGFDYGYFSSEIGATQSDDAWCCIWFREVHKAKGPIGLGPLAGLLCSYVYVSISVLDSEIVPLKFNNRWTMVQDASTHSIFCGKLIMHKGMMCKAQRRILAQYLDLVHKPQASLGLFPGDESHHSLPQGLFFWCHNQHGRVHGSHWYQL